MAKHSFTQQRSGSSTPTLDQSYRDDSRVARNKRGPQSGTNISFGEEEEEQYQIRTPISPPISFHNMRSQSFSSARGKIRPLLKKKSSDAPGIDLSKSMAENEEGLGIFIQPPRVAHTRSSSGVSIVTVNSVNHRAGTQYKQTYTPPFHLARSRAQSSEDLPSTSYAPKPSTTRTPPPLHIRTHSTSSNPRIRSASQLQLDNPQSATSIYRETFSPESMGKSARSSMESAFRRRKTNDTDMVAAAAEARREFAARQEAKRIKYERQEARLREKEERLQERRSRANTIASEKDSHISSIKYQVTRPGVPVDKELEYIRAGIRPPGGEHRNTTSSIKKKARGTMNSFEKFFYDLHTAWLKFLISIGLKKKS